MDVFQVVYSSRKESGADNFSSSSASAHPPCHQSTESLETKCQAFKDAFGLSLEVTVLVACVLHSCLGVLPLNTAKLHTVFGGVKRCVFHHFNMVEASHITSEI